MTQQALVKHYRKGISLPELFRMFPDDDAAQEWLEQQRWGDEPWCPHCGSYNVRRNNHKSMPWRCAERECRKRFSVRTGTLMYKSPLGYQTWVVALYLLNTSLKSVSSMKLHRDLKITQKTAWHLAHRIRESYSNGSDDKLLGPVEVDETYMGGKRQNMSSTKRKEQAHLGRGTAGKTAVVGVKDRKSNKVRAKVIESTNAHTLQSFVIDNADPSATVYTDDASAYDGLPFEHETVRHSVGEYVRKMAHTNGVESFWSGLKRGLNGTYHKMSKKHLHRYVNEFSGRHNVRPNDTIDQMESLARNMEGKQLTYEELIS